MSEADRRFISLAALLAPAPQPEPQAPAIVAIAPPPHASDDAEIVAAVQAACRFRAQLAAVFAHLVTDVARDLAVDITARELALAPVAIADLARRLFDERLSDGPVRVRVAPSDLARITDLPTVADPSLAPGDAVLECTHGEIDARLGVRLAALIERFAP